MTTVLVSLRGGRALSMRIRYPNNFPEVRGVQVLRQGAGPRVFLVPGPWGVGSGDHGNRLGEGGAKSISGSLIAGGHAELSLGPFRLFRGFERLKGPAGSQDRSSRFSMSSLYCQPDSTPQTCYNQSLSPHAGRLGFFWHDVSRH